MKADKALAESAFLYCFCEFIVFLLIGYLMRFTHSHYILMMLNV